MTQTPEPGSDPSAPATSSRPGSPSCEGAWCCGLCAFPRGMYLGETDIQTLLLLEPRAGQLQPSQCIFGILQIVEKSLPHIVGRQG
ncbi:hypothetical protein AAY473_009984 [Plecturocebus cupreus]